MSIHIRLVCNVNVKFSPQTVCVCVCGVFLEEIFHVVIFFVCLPFFCRNLNSYKEGILGKGGSIFFPFSKFSSEIWLFVNVLQTGKRDQRMQTGKGGFMALSPQGVIKLTVGFLPSGRGPFQCRRCILSYLLNIYEILKNEIIYYHIIFFEESPPPGPPPLIVISPSGLTLRSWTTP